MITFGENGWFGVISEEVGFETISIVAQAAADYLNDQASSEPVVLGYDTRFLSREYAWLIQRVLTANRIKVFMHKKPVPTSFLSLSVQFHQAALGIMVTGEGRPARYSGLTFRLPSGCPVSKEWMKTLFNYLYRRYPRSSEDSRHLLQYIDHFPEYVDRLGKLLDMELIRRKNPYVASDSFFGSVGTYMQDMMKKLDINGIHIRTKPNPGFMDSIPQPNDRNMNPISRLVAQKKGDMGLFFNGDGSIMGAVSPQGQIIPNEWASAVILDEWLKAKGQDFDIYTEIFTPGLASDLLSRLGMEALPLHRLEEENRNPDKAIIWDRHCLRFGSFMPDRDAMFQGMLLLQALCRCDLDWRRFTECMNALTGARYQEQKSVNLDSGTWEKKQKDLPGRIEELIPDKLYEIIEEGDDTKLAFMDGTWMGYNYNIKENSLFLYYDKTAESPADNILTNLIGWLTE